MASLNDVKMCFEAVNTANIDELIKTVKTLLKRDKPQKMPPEWISFIDSGDKFLSFVNQQEEKFGDKVDLFRSDGRVVGVISSILEEVGKIHWAVAGLSLIGHLLAKVGQMSENRDECLQLLQNMLDLAEHINNLERLLLHEKEKLTNAFVIIVKGSMLCAKQLCSNKTLFRFLKSSLDAKNLSSLRSEINVLYPDLTLTAVRATLLQQPQRLPVRQPDRPAQAVGLEVRERQVEDMLEMSKQDESFRAVVIYGIGGIGKTYLANAVYSKLNLNGYNCCRVVMDSDPQKNEIKKKQEQILKDAFPNYNSGRAIDLRDNEEGRDHLRRAFQEASKPVFLVIDNVLRAEDLKDLLPQDLERLGKHIRLLLTARNLKAANMFKKRFRHGYLVESLPNSDAIKFLCNETEDLIRIKDVDSILDICNGIPLVLKIVGAELENQEYKAEKCREILNALQTGKEIKGERLSERMVDFVFREFEEFIQEAFLDICCFFNGINRTLVESSVGSGALKALQDAALITIKLEPEYYAPMQENEEIVVVHDVIKAKGQNMAQSTRIRDIESFQTAVEEKRLQNIRGIELWCDKDHSSYVLKRQHLNSMSKSLRVLKLGPNISVSNESKMTFPELRYVYLDHNIPFVPFNSKALPKLAVYVGPLLKGGLSIYKLPQSLIHISTFQSDGKCKNWDESKPMQVAPNSSLEDLTLTSFSMKTLPKGLHGFNALRTLRLENWYEMEELPEVICGLHWLSKLSLVKCRFKHLPQSFGELTGLVNLSLECCERFEELPSSLGHLKALKYLNLKRCTSLKKLPPTFGELAALEGLNLKKCVHLEEIPGFKKLTGLRYLNIQDCPELRCDFGNAHKDLQIEEKGIEEEEELPHRSLIRIIGIQIRIHQIVLHGASRLEIPNNKILSHKMTSNNKRNWSVVVGSVILFSFSTYLFYQIKIDPPLNTWEFIKLV